MMENSGTMGRMTSSRSFIIQDTVYSTVQHVLV